MKIVYGVAALAMAAGLIWAWTAMTAQLTLAGAPDLTPVVLFLEASVIAKLVMITCLLITIFGAMTALFGPIIALFRQPAAARILALCLAPVGAIPALLGALAWGYGEYILAVATAQVGMVDAAVTAPGRAEGLLALALGLFPGLILIGSAFLTVVLADVFKPRPRPA
jgi:hypothetical protein